MKTVSIIALLVLAAPAFAQTPPKQYTQQEKQMMALEQMLEASDQSRIQAYADHEAAIRRAFGSSQRKDNASPANMNAVAPAAGGNTGLPVPTYTPQAAPAPAPAAQDQTRTGGGFDGNAKTLPLGLGNVPYK